MITGDIENKVDAVWDAFWTGGISDPLEVMEQITYSIPHGIPPVELRMKLESLRAGADSMKNSHRTLTELDALFASFRSRPFRGEL